MGANENALVRGHALGANASDDLKRTNSALSEPVDAASVISVEAHRLAEVLATAPPDALCPTCPEWTGADLLWHLTEVHTFWARILGEDARTDEAMRRVEESAPVRPDSIAAMLPIRAAATTALLDQLAALADSEPRWSWWESDQTVGFTRRMQVCEATMHRVDAELTARLPVSPIDAPIAAATVDQCVDVMWGWKPDWAPYEAEAALELVASDTGQRWQVEVGHWFGTSPHSGREFDEIRAVRAGSDSGAASDTAELPSATVTAPVTDLALWAWTRGSEVDMSGDATAIAAVSALIERGIQ